jgi:hypothetical protein
VLQNLHLVIGLETEHHEATKQETSAALDVSELIRMNTVCKVELRAVKGCRRRPPALVERR